MHLLSGFDFLISEEGPWMSGQGPRDQKTRFIVCSFLLYGLECILLFNFFITFILCVPAHHSMSMKVREDPEELVLDLLIHRSKESNSNPQAWQRVPLPHWTFSLALDKLFYSPRGAFLWVSKHRVCCRDRLRSQQSCDDGNIVEKLWSL